MSVEPRQQSEQETPIERIFQKVMGRKMTAEERALFHLENGRPHALDHSKNGVGTADKYGPKLTRP